MTNVTKTPEKKRLRVALVGAALSALEQNGWTVTKVKGHGKGRIRRIKKNGKTQLAVVRTTQDTWFAFPRNETDTDWVTLSEVDLVAVASVDDPERPRFARVHLFDAAEVRQRFDRAYAARRAAGHTIPIGRGVWVSLYDEEGTSPVQRVGAGIGLAFPEIARVPLVNADTGSGGPPPTTSTRTATDEDDDGGPLTIAQAKRRLARTLGVDPGNIRITIEG